jgi:hypothetical protein
VDVLLLEGAPEACERYSLSLHYSQLTQIDKQIWFIHHRVCGKNSNPFKWPPFSRKEKERVYDNAMIRGKYQQYSWFERSAARYPAEDRDHPIETFKVRLLPYPLQGLRRTLNVSRLQSHLSVGDVDESKWTPGLNRFVVQIRAAHFGAGFDLLWNGLPQQHNLREMGDVVAELPLDYIAWQQDTIVPELTQNLGDFPSFTKFQHKHFLYATLVAIAASHRTPHHQLRSYMEYSHRQFRECVETEVAKTHPTQAQRILRCWPSFDAGPLPGVDESVVPA